MKIESLSLSSIADTREDNKVVPALPVEEVSEELLSLLNDSSLTRQLSELESLRSFEQKGLDFEVPTCSTCNEGNPFLFKVNGSNYYCCFCGHKEE